MDKLKSFTSKIVIKTQAEAAYFFGFWKKSPKSEKIQSWKKVIFDAKIQKYRTPDLYSQILELELQEKWHFFEEKKFPTLVIFFEQITLSGTSRELHLSLYFKKLHSKLAKFLHLVFTGCAKQMSFYEVGAWNVYWCVFSKVGEVKKQFFLIFGIFCW